MITKGKKIGIAIFLIIVIGIIFLYQVNFFLIGPGYPPPDSRPYFTIPSNYDLSWNNWQESNKSFLWTPEFEAISQLPNETPPPEFPSLSTYSGSGYFQKPGHGELIVVQSWYFDDYNRFIAMQGQLRDFLEKNGHTDTLLLNITTRNPYPYNFTCNSTSTANNTIKGWCSSLGTKQFQVTSYSDNKTAGYFFAAEIPIRSSRNDFFIEYYGIFNAPQPKESLPMLNEFMELCHSRYELEGNLYPVGSPNSAGISQ